LTKHFVRSLNTIIDDYDSLNKYEKIVICCPLHYVRYIDVSSSNFDPRTEESELLKLIYIIDYETELNPNSSLYCDLKDFYKKTISSYKRRRGKMSFYDDVYSVAALWFRHIEGKTDHKHSSEIIDEITYE